MIKINGVSLPDPSGLSLERQPQSALAERNASGLLNRETLPDKTVLKVKWSYLEEGELADLLTFLFSHTRDFFTLTYPSPLGGTDSFEAYISPFSAAMLNYGVRYGTRWKSISCNFIER